MVKCGITKYDALPSRVGWIDIDSLRYRLVQNKFRIQRLEADNVEIRVRLDEIAHEQEKGE